MIAQSHAYVASKLFTFTFTLPFTFTFTFTCTFTFTFTFTNVRLHNLYALRTARWRCHHAWFHTCCCRSIGVGRRRRHFESIAVVVDRRVEAKDATRPAHLHACRGHQKVRSVYCSRCCSGTQRKLQRPGPAKECRNKNSNNEPKRPSAGTTGRSSTGLDRKIIPRVA